MLVRGVLCRLAADAPKTSAQDLPQLARFLNQSILRGNTFSVTTSRALSCAYNIAVTKSRRSYATARTTKSTTASKKPVTKKPAPKKKPATKKKTTTTRSATASKKATPKKKATKKAVKPKPKPRPRKRVPTPEQKQKELIKDLKLKALREPVSGRSLTAYNIFLQSKLKGTHGQPINQDLKTISQEFKTLTVAQREHWNHLTHEANATRQAEYNAWVNSYTPSQIREANNARRRLRALRPETQKARSQYTSPIQDERQVTRPLTAYIHFARERQLTDDFKGISGVNTVTQIAKEWKSLTAGEKQKYENAAKAAKETYLKDVKRVYQDA